MLFIWESFTWGKDISCVVNGLKVLDLFSGMGGLSYGFKMSGFDVTGVDMFEYVERTYRELVGSKFLRMDMRDGDIDGDYDVIVGGPPCRPWSSVNLSRRGKNHRDHDLIGRFFDQIVLRKPSLFTLENVPILRGDTEFLRQIRRARKAGYSVTCDLVKFSDYGAATARRRLIAVGVREGTARYFLAGLYTRKTNPRNVKDEIFGFRNREKGALDDHIWPELKTIEKYREKYLTGKFGWRILSWEQPAPSFGNVMKTYTLHPDSDLNARRYRVVSVLEVSRIMGFNHGFHFPRAIGLGHRYQMLADSVSPIFSSKLASVIEQYLKEM